MDEFLLFGLPVLGVVLIAVRFFALVVYTPPAMQRRGPARKIFGIAAIVIGAACVIAGTVLWLVLIALLDAFINWFDNTFRGLS